MTVAELIDQALPLDPDEGDDYWNLVLELQRRHDEETYTAAVALTRDADPNRRELGVDILGQLGGERNEADRPFREGTIVLLLDLIAAEQHPRVLTAIAFAFGHIHDPRTIAPAIGLAGHADAHVRYGVVHGLSGHDDDRAVDTLVALTEDPADRVRDWATFELGTILDRDTPQVRDALAARLRDPHRDTHGEAIVGLAKRGDPRALAVLIEDYEEGWEGPMIDEAGEFYVEAGLLESWPPPGY